MAEEIVQSWETLDELFVELNAPDHASDIRKVRERIRLVMEDPTPASDGQSMHFRLVDGDGRDVAFPLKLISNTTFGPLRS